MKTIKNKTLMTIITLMALIFPTYTVSAADMWAETPDLNHDAEAPSVIAEPHAFKYESPRVDMWAESPNLDAGKEDHGVRIEGEYRFANTFNPEMYAETPGLNETLPRPQPETIDSILLAKEK
jgi:hypothetical protein